MSERARALEQALRMLIDAAVQTACKIAEDGDRRWHVVDLVCATNDAEKLLAVDPPPSGASPTTTNQPSLNAHPLGLVLYPSAPSGASPQAETSA